LAHSREDCKSFDRIVSQQTTEKQNLDLKINQSKILLH